MTARLLEVAEATGTPVTDALNVDLWELLKLDREPPPVLFKAFQGDWSGACIDQELTESDELEVHSQYRGQTRFVSLQQARMDLVGVYVHELAHRLTPGHSHNAVFATVNLAMLVRANAAHKGIPFRGFKLYDFQDHILDQVPGSVSEAAAFVMHHGIELGESDLPMSGVVAEASTRWKAHLQEIEERPKREQAAAAKVANLEGRITDLQAELRQATSWALAAACAAVIAFGGLAWTLYR